MLMSIRTTPVNAKASSASTSVTPDRYGSVLRERACLIPESSPLAGEIVRSSGHERFPAPHLLSSSPLNPRRLSARSLGSRATNILGSASWPENLKTLTRQAGRIFARAEAPSVLAR